MHNVQYKLLGSASYPSAEQLYVSCTDRVNLCDMNVAVT
jgi:hypothetical protein